MTTDAGAAPPARVPAECERCSLCGGRHQDRLIPGGRRMLTILEAAIHLNTTPAIVRRLIRTDELKALKLSPRNVRIREADLVEFQDR